ncbi:NAD(P)-dependent oxidoreductase [bacterium]|nr:NAD(P)-dependent oxidoreductase [bacterium]
MNRVLVTGASGFLGYNLCKDLQSNYEVFATRHLTDPVCPVKDSVLLDLKGSIKPVEMFVAENKIDAIIHLAALSKAGTCAGNPDLAKEINVAGTRALAEVASRQSAAFIFLSSDLVYNSGSGPHTEDDADPHLVYSETKFDAEMEAFLAHPSTVVFRSALIFGNDDGVHGSFLRDNENDLKAGKSLTLFSDQFRSPVWSKDIARAVHLIIQKNIRSRIFNIGGDTRINRYDFGIMAAEIFGWNDDLMIPVAMEAFTGNAPFLKDCSLDSSRLKSETGWEATPLETALKQVAAEWNPVTR